MLNQNNTRLLLIIILLLYLALAIGYGVVNPLFEAPDEHHHYFTVQYIADNRSLPTIESGGELARQEAAQPPLYYLAAAPLVSMINTSGAGEQLWFNPTVRNGEATPLNVNDFIHTERESWPWQGYALAAHLVRVFSTLIGLGTLLTVFGSGRLLWPESPAAALLATALVAFLPQFGFLHGAITNDVLIIFFSSFVLWQLLWIFQHQASPIRLVFLGVSIGLAVLAKMAGLMLLPLAFLVLALMAWRDRPLSWQGLLRSAAIVAVPVLLIGGWLLLRNWIHYGDPTAVNQFVAMAGKNRQFTLRQVWHDMDRVAMSAVAYFGWMNVQAPDWIYVIWKVILLLSGAGWIYGTWRRRSQPTENFALASGDRANMRLVALWMGVWVAVVFAAWLRFMMQTPADQGRLLFPALLPVALFVAHGLVLWRQRWLVWLVPLVALITSLYALLVVIPGAYYTVELLTEQEIPASASRYALDMGYGIELIAVEAQTTTMQPGEWAWVDLYWRAAEPVTEAPFQGLGMYGRNNDLVGWQENYHGGGTYPPNLWIPGQVVKDRVAAQLVDHAELPAELRLLMRINDSYDPVEIARVKAVPVEWPEADDALLATFGEGIDLTSVSLTPADATRGSEIAVDVQWVVRNAPGKELTTFLHLGDPTQAPLAQGDGPALGGDYPTNLWAAGEVINDRYLLTVPGDLLAGSYPIHIGFYDPLSGARLAVEIEGQAHDAYLAGWLTVRE